MSFTFRAATSADIKTIRAIIREADINPLGLKWQNFLLALDEQTGAIAATGQIKMHGDGSSELASIATRPPYQNQGLASAIVQKLVQKHFTATTQPLYLICDDKMPGFYLKFNFRVIEREEMPPYFRRITRIASFVEMFARVGLKPMVMKRDHA